jgi:hypothetical protein
MSVTSYPSRNRTIRDLVRSGDLDGYAFYAYAVPNPATDCPEASMAVVAPIGSAREEVLDELVLTGAANRRTGASCRGAKCRLRRTTPGQALRIYQRAISHRTTPAYNPDQAWQWLRADSPDTLRMLQRWASER